LLWFVYEAHQHQHRNHQPSHFPPACFQLQLQSSSNIYLIFRFPNNSWTLGNNHHVIMKNLNTAKALKGFLFIKQKIESYWVIKSDKNG
jgi:hypothetical protein